MIGGLLTSLMVFSGGAILDFAVATSSYRHGLDTGVLGLILMIVGGAGMFLTTLALATKGDMSRYHPVMPERGAKVFRREDTFA